MTDRRGHRIASRFVIEKLLGVGGSGSSVWIANDTKLHKSVALKLLLATDPQEQARFERGAILAQSLQHPSIAPVIDHGKDGDLSWVSMELLSGETLASRVSVSKSMTPKAAVLIADQVLAALEHAHAAEIVHRDLKPANLFLAKPAKDGEEERVLILDFGIARLVGPSAAERFGPFFPDDDPIAPELESEVTGEHRICGTPEYMAPEQILGGEPDIRSDFYALGIILYRLVAGHLPFRARSRYEVYHRHLHETPPPLPGVLGAPVPFSVAIHRAMAKEPSDRFGTAADMRATLRASVGLPPVTRPKLFPIEYEVRAIPEPEGFGLLPGISPLPVAEPVPSLMTPKNFLLPAPVQAQGVSTHRRARVVYSAIGAVLIGLAAWLAISQTAF